MGTQIKRLLPLIVHDSAVGRLSRRQGIEEGTAAENEEKSEYTRSAVAKASTVFDFSDLE